MKNNKCIIAIFIILYAIVLLLISCGTPKSAVKISNNNKYSMEIYNNYLKTYGNAYMITASDDKYSVIWYYNQAKINIVDVSNARIFSSKAFNCEISLNSIRYDKNNKDLIDNTLDGEIFESSIHLEKEDTICRTTILLDVDVLKNSNPKDPYLKMLKSHIVKYKLWDMVQYPVK